VVDEVLCSPFCWSGHLEVETGDDAQIYGVGAKLWEVSLSLLGEGNELPSRT